MVKIVKLVGAVNFANELRSLFLKLFIEDCCTSACWAKASGIAVLELNSADKQAYIIQS